MRERIDKLRRRLGERPCAVCEARRAVAFINEGDPLPADLGEKCPACNRTPRGVLFVEASRPKGDTHER